MPSRHEPSKGPLLRLADPCRQGSHTSRHRTFSAGFRSLSLAVLGAFVPMSCASFPPAGPEITTRPSGGDGTAAAGESSAVPATTGCVVRAGGIDVIRGDEPSMGPADAPVTVLEFSDLECRFCKRAQGTIDQLLSEYGSKIRLVWKHQPLGMHRMAKPAARIAQGVFEMAGAAPFWRFVHLSFSTPSDLSRDLLVDLAKQAGVSDTETLRHRFERGEWASAIDRDLDLAHALGSDGTPHFFVNGTEVSGSKSIDKFREIVDIELALASLTAMTGGVSTAGCDRLRDVVSERIAANASKGDAQAEAIAAATAERRERAATVWKVPIAGSPVRGPDTALVTIVEFSDFECPFCQRVEKTLDKVRAKYGDKVRIVWKDEPLPFHAHAEPAAELAREAFARKGNAGFWAMHDAILASSPKLDGEDLLALAKAQGLNESAVSSALVTHKHRKAIDTDIALADDLDATGTPHFFLNGRRLVGAQPLSSFEEIIDEEITKAQALIDRGASAKNVYDRLIADGKTPPPPERKIVALPTGNAPSRGPSTAKVTIQMFSDFQCPFCARTRATMDQITAAYPSSVRLVWRHMPLPFHDHAMLAAEAAEEAFVQGGNKAFWAMHDLLFENQGADDGLSRAALDGYAARVGLDGKRFAAALDAHTHQTKIKADIAAAEGADVSGTPSFVLNGYYVSGAQSFARFKKVIDLALSTP